MDNLAQKAIEAATSGKWKEAVEINLEILENSPEDIDALNRLARAYAELGKVKQAIRTAQRVLKISHFDQIAKKNIEKWKKIKSNQYSTSSGATADSFIEEPGKTKIVPLVYTTDPNTIASLDAGDEVTVSVKGNCVQITNKDGKYIGRLPDDVGSRLKKLINLGNKYQVFIKNTELNKVRVFIREIKKSKRAEKIPSFIAEKIDYVSFTPPELVHNKEEIKLTNYEESEE